MPKPKFHEFRVRMLPDLMARIDKARGHRSKNELINDWLWSKARGDHADQIADALRPVLASLSDEDKSLFAERAISTIDALAKGLSKRRS